MKGSRLIISIVMIIAVITFIVQPASFADSDSSLAGFTVAFDANGGSGAPEAIQSNDEGVVIIPSIIPGKYPCNFSGWAKSKDASSAEFIPGDQVRLTGDMVLYAVWDDAYVIEEDIAPIRASFPYRMMDQYLVFTPETTCIYTISAYARAYVLIYRKSTGELVTEYNGTMDSGASEDVELSADDSYYLRTYYVNTLSTGSYFLSVKHTNMRGEEDLPATCTEDGHTGFYGCDVCGKVYIAKEVIPATGHDMEYTEAKEPTYDMLGNISYYWCRNCRKYFLDEAGENEIGQKDIFIPKLERPNMKDAVIELTGNIFNTSGRYWRYYDGTINASVKVAYNGKELENSTDYYFYTVQSPVRTVKLGTIRAIVLGRGEYRGSAEIPFTICFKDVPLTHNYSNAVYWAFDKRITAGYSGDRTGTFGVNDRITRGQVIRFLWGAANEPLPEDYKTQTFSDIPVDHNYYRAIQWAYELGITSGYSGKRAGQFGSNDSCTRGQIVTFLWRYAGRPEPSNTTTQTFSDVPVSHSYFKAIQWAYENGITGGYSGAREGQFGPSDKCTRGQCVTFLYRLLGKSDEQDNKE